MDDPRWIRLITVGLVLAALAVGYFLLTGRFTSNNVQKNQNQINEVTPIPQPTIMPDATTNSPSSTPSAMAAARRNITILPRTGYQQVLLAIIAFGVMISGLGLRKFPH